MSGSTDADKLDYLLRDTHFAGTTYGVYDIDRLIESATIIGSRETQTFLGFDIGGLWAVEGLLLARHHMWRQVYGHKTRLATDIMLTRALLAGVEQGVLPRDAYVIPVENDKAVPNATFLAAFVEETDSSVLERLRHAEEGTPARDLTDRLLQRRLLRQTETVALHREHEGIDPVRQSDLLDPEQFTKADIEASEMRIADELGLDRHLVAIYIDRWSNPTYRRPGIGRTGRIHLRDGDRTTFLELESEIFHPELREEHVYLYLYIPEVDDDAQTRAKELLWEVLRSG